MVRSIRNLAAAATVLLTCSFAPLALSASKSAEPGGERRFNTRELLAQRKRVAAATVTLPLKSCAGSIAGSATQVLTAAHCVPEGVEELDVIFRGRRLRAVVALIDRTRDTALLALSEALDVEPLPLALDLPERGDRVLFVGRVDRPSRVQVERVVRLGKCPSLPGVDDAVFTNLSARPGDSGAPILNDALHIVGVIHGGAACHIAAPTAALARELSTRSRREQKRPPPDPSTSGGWGERAGTRLLARHFCHGAAVFPSASGRRGR